MKIDEVNISLKFFETFKFLISNMSDAPQAFGKIVRKIISEDKIKTQETYLSALALHKLYYGNINGVGVTQKIQEFLLNKFNFNTFMQNIQSNYSNDDYLRGL